MADLAAVATLTESLFVPLLESLTIGVLVLLFGAVVIVVVTITRAVPRVSQRIEAAILPPILPALLDSVSQAVVEGGAVISPITIDATRSVNAA